ncbi:MAG: hypothetical protein R3A78_15285 [Polyangiales bacterium]
MAAADDAPPAAAETTTTGTTTTEVNQTQSDLEREQSEFEQEEQPNQEEVVVESKAELEARQATEEDEKNSRGHSMQIGLRAGFGVPFVFAVRYGSDGIPCNPTGSNICGRFKKAISEYELSFGLSDGFELTGLFRMGLAKDEISGSLPMGMGFGFRSYTSPKSIFKFYLGLKAMIDFTSSDLPGWKSTDFGGRGEVGIQFDIVRYVGIWGHIAESIMVVRNFAFITDLMAGVQVRFP